MCGAELKGKLAEAWRVLAQVPDPEVPAISVVDLGLVREVRSDDEGLQVVLTPTYSGCPATELIAADVRAALEAEGLGPVSITLRRAPAWTTDWISEAGRHKLLAAGIAPPGRCADEARSGPGVVMRFVAPALACPRCASRRTERLSAFGATACKALHRCLACGEPFEHFKPI